MTRWVETDYDHLMQLVDPTGQGLITSFEMESDQNPVPYMRKAQPVMIRGHRFASITQAAQRLGVGKDTIRRAIATDTLDDVRPKHMWKVDGLEFETLVDAAIYFDKSVKYIRARAEPVHYKDPVTAF